MKKRDKIQRIEYLSEEQRGVRSLLASNNILSSRLSGVVTGNSWDLKSQSDLRKLLFTLDTEIDQSTVRIYSQVIDENSRMAELGVKHSINNLQEDVKVQYFNTIGTGDTIARDYAQKRLRDGKQLSERIWTSPQRAEIYRIVGDSVKLGDNSFELAQKIQNYVGNDYPRYLIDRLANTELIQAYTNGKKETYGSFLNEFSDEFQVVVDIELSPMHPVDDICDLVVGTYDLNSAPDVPIHPGCICSRTERIAPAKRNIPTETVGSLISKREKMAEDLHIYIPKEAGGIAI